MSDLISRTEIISTFTELGKTGRYGGMCEWVIEIVKQLPPAELGTDLAEVGTDCISRRSAIDALRAMQTYKLFAGDDMLLIDQAGAQTELMLLPPIQPKRGRWINCDGGIATCSICGDRWGVYGVMNFCPSCGAKMEGTT